MTVEDVLSMADAFEEVFGQDYDPTLPELDCPVCGTYAYCDCQTTDLEKF